MAMIKKITPNIYYHIVSKKNNKVMDVDALAACNDGGAVQIYDKIGTENQQFKFVADSSKKYYKIVCRNSKKPIDIVSVGSSNGAQIHQWSDTDVETQLWDVEFNSDGYFKIVSKHSNKVLDAGLDDSNSSRLHIWDDVDSDNQLWYLEKPANSYKSKPCKNDENFSAKKVNDSIKPSNPIKKINTSLLSSSLKTHKTNSKIKNVK